MTADGAIARDAMLAMATELALQLRGDWSATPDPYEHDRAACLVHPNGAEIFLEMVRWPPAGKGRLSISGRYAHSEDHRIYGPAGKDRPAITVALERGTNAIARDIAQRFLPDYLESLRTHQEALREHAEDLRDAERAAIRIAVAAGVAPERFGSREAIWVVRTVDGLIKVRDSHKGSPHIEIRFDGVDVEHAEKIARAYRPLEDVVREVFREPDKKSDGPVPIDVAQCAPRMYSPLMNTATTAKRTIKTAKVVALRDLKERDWTKFGHHHAGRQEIGQHAEITVGVSIRLFGTYKSYPYNKAEGRAVETDVAYDRVFKLGDAAEYDSYNMAYTGTIAAIGEKTVTIEDGHKVRRLSIFDFARRNRDLDLEEIAARNFDVMMHC